MMMNDYYQEVCATPIKQSEAASQALEAEKKQLADILGLNGLYFKRGRIGVLIIHGVTGTVGEMKKYAKIFASQNYTVLFPELAGHGGSFSFLKKYRFACCSLSGFLFVGG